MSGPAATLRELHRLRRHVRDLQNEINRGPLQLKAQQTKVARQEEALKQANEALNQAKVTMRKKEGDLKEAQLRMAKYEQQRNQATSKKEYDAFQAEIGAVKKECHKLEDQILEVMGEVEQKTAALPEQEKAVEKAKAEVAEFARNNQVRLGNLGEQLKETEKQLAEVEAALPADVSVAYKRQVTARGEDALAAVQGRSCTACYTEITAQSYNELVQGLFVLCKNCGRIMYLPE